MDEKNDPLMGVVVPVTRSVYMAPFDADPREWSVTIGPDMTLDKDGQLVPLATEAERLLMSVVDWLTTEHCGMRADACDECKSIRAALVYLDSRGLLKTEGT